MSVEIIQGLDLYFDTEMGAFLDYTRQAGAQPPFHFTGPLEGVFDGFYNGNTFLSTNNTPDDSGNILALTGEIHAVNVVQPDLPFFDPPAPPSSQDPWVGYYYTGYAEGDIVLNVSGNIPFSIVAGEYYVKALNITTSEYVIVETIIVLSAGVLSNSEPLTSSRPEDYDPTLDWSWVDGVWGDYPDILAKGGGRYKNSILVVGELTGNGVIYMNLPAVPEIVSYPITGGYQATPYFYISGDHAGEINDWGTIEVFDSTGNDGVYTVDFINNYAQYNAGEDRTEINVVEAIPSEMFDGSLKQS